MGVYDEVGPECFQIKCTPDPALEYYEIGDEIPLRDGLYVTREGWFTVKVGKVYDYGEDIFDKWGNRLQCKEVIDSRNYIRQAVEGLEK